MYSECAFNNRDQEQLRLSTRKNANRLTLKGFPKGSIAEKMLGYKAASLELTVMRFYQPYTLNFKNGYMRESLRKKITEVCDKKIVSKGDNVGLSFYAFFANKNDNPELLMEAAEWWIMTHKLDHFEKAIKIRKMVQGADV